MIYNITFDICAGVISIFSLYVIISQKGLQKESNQLLLFVIIAALISAVFDIWSSVGNSYINQYTYFSRDILNYIFLFVHTSTACLFAWYMIVLLGLKHRIKKPLFVLFLLPEALAIFLPLALNPVLGWVFYYDVNGIYSHGVMIYALYGAGYLYMLLTVYLAIRFRNLLLKSQRYAAIMLLIFSIIPIFVQQFFMPHQLLELFFQSIGIFGFLTTVENLDAIYSPVTKVYNRAAFLRSINLAFQNQTDLNVVMVKLSRSHYFGIATLGAGYINGFMAGAAEWLNSLSKKIDVYDCERGHFALTVFRDSYDMQLLTEKIARKFSGEWQYKNQMIRLPIQICAVDLKATDWTVEDLMRLVDLSYIGHNEQPVIVKTEELKAAEQERTAGESEEGQFASDVLNMLDSFVERTAALTPAERNILKYYIDGREIAEIPGLAFISIHTVRKHNKNIYRKLAVSTKEELVLYIDLLRRSNRLAEVEKLIY
ncbi:LuxR C-terminal-related transcriptional regulator [Christensenella tenuis]|uniref:Helix-turn-helix transcriptional regulator n=1 Tax=Christensenella tenuis TaxID=2763033 RepID=A0ABR7EHC9_9FIRM|nr:LuxR C-terminal-related transcriptional regulator [Christensenella tenuis]MBC5649166.1 helix-turn-helix transcriptional regulator [Christensenella tenuis]